MNDNCINTIYEIIEARKYLIIFENENIILSQHEYNKEYFCIIKRIYFKFITDSIKECLEIINNIFHDTVQYKVNHAMVIYKTSVTSVANEIVKSLSYFYNTNKYTITNKSIMKFFESYSHEYLKKDLELFSFNSLQFNITKHVLQPKFEPLTLEDKNNIKCNINIFPIIKTTDPIAKFYNMKNNDIIRIIKDGIISYRIVKSDIFIKNEEDEIIDEIIDEN